MMLIFLGIGLVCLVVGITALIKLPSYYKRSDAQTGFIWTFNAIGGILSGLSLTVIICLIGSLVWYSTYDKKIEIYTEENTKIETQISRVVSQYQEYEQNTFESLKNTTATDESVVALVSLYPELKSDTLVQKQIETYVANNEEIKKLKSEKLNVIPIKWWLFFGS